MSPSLATQEDLTNKLQYFCGSHGKYLLRKTKPNQTPKEFLSSYSTLVWMGISFRSRSCTELAQYQILAPPVTELVLGPHPNVLIQRWDFITLLRYGECPQILAVPSPLLSSPPVFLSKLLHLAEVTPKDILSYQTQRYCEGLLHQQQVTGWLTGWASSNKSAITPRTHSS